MIETEGLTKRFASKSGPVEAVRGLDLRIDPGELVAFLGPNGAGKATTLRMLATLLRPTSGRATVAGVDVVADPAGVRRRIGYIGQGNGAGHHFRVRDELVTQGRCYGLSSARPRARADVLLAALELEGLAGRVVGTLSGGQRRRLDLAIGLMHEPPVLFLDEPTAGLDPHHRANLWEHVGALRASSETTVVLTTHYLEEADTIAERVLVISHGSLIADDTPERLKRELAGDRIRIEVPAGAAARARDLVEPHASAVDVTSDGTRAFVTMIVVDGGARLPQVLHDLSTSGVTVASVRLDQPTLDDVFLGLTGRSLREEPAVAA